MTRVLFASTPPYLPQGFGGSEVSTHSIALSLRKRGFEVGIMAGLRDGNWLWLKNRVISKLSGTDVYTMDKFSGYPVYRGWGISGIPAVIEKFKPDIVLMQVGPVRAYSDLFLSLGIPVAVCIRDLAFGGGNLIEAPSLRYIANSGYVANKLYEKFGIRGEVITPLVLPDKYRVDSTRESVVFVNPVEAKGLEISLRLAEARPDIPFDFVESWQQGALARRSERVRRAKNIHWHKSQMDVRSIYGRARLLLMPSQWEEPWGRCATEAQVSGIPVLATRSGGLPDAVGPGGILVDRKAPIDDWLEALSRMWDDKQHYEFLVQEAFRYSQRPEIQPEMIVDRLVHSIMEHIGGPAFA